MSMKRPERPRFPVLLASIFCLLAIGIAVSGLLYYQEQKRTIQHERNDQLAAIAELKAGQIDAWRRERLADGEFIRENRIAVQAIGRLLSGASSPDLQREVHRWMMAYKARHGYTNLFLLDAKGAVRLSTAQETRAMEAENLSLATQAMKSAKVSLSDLHRDAERRIYLDICVPLSSQGQAAPLGALLLEVDPRQSLYPMIQSWPMPSKTAETLLLRREGDEVLYLNELRHRKGTALSFRLPVATTALSRVAPVPGPRGVGEAVDYRGVPVVAAARPVPDSTWILIAKIDLEEIYGPIRRTAQSTGAIGLLLFAASATGVLLLWRHQQARFYQRQYAAEIERQGLVERLEYLSRDANDVILLSDDSGKILDANKRALWSYGYSLRDLLQMTMAELWAAAASPSFETHWSRIKAAGSLVFETNHQRKDRSTFPVEVSTRLIPYQGGTYCQSIIRDISERKTAQGWLRLLESAILQSSDGVMIVEISGQESCRPLPIFINSAFKRMTGFSLEDLRQGALRLLHGPDAELPLLQHQSESSPGSCPVHAEHLTCRKDGSEFWAELNLIPLTDDDNNLNHCVWTFRDISERKRSEESSRLLSSIVESSDDAIISKNLDGTILSWNSGAERIYGYSAGEMLGQPISVLFPPDRHGELPDLMGHLRLGLRIEHLETERVKKDGRHIFVSLTISPIRDANNHIAGASVIARDITGRKRAERELLLSEERYRSLAFVTTQIVWTTNPAGEVVEDIPQWRAFTGQSPEEIQGWGWIEALHPEDRERTTDVWSRALRNHSFYETEYRIRRRDGQYRCMAVHGVPVLEKDGVIREWVGACEDITERRLAEDEIRKLNEELEQRVTERTVQLQAANQELEAFVYSVSHDLRAPLRAVDGFSRILLEEHASQLSADAQRYLQFARTNAVQMGNLIDALLAFSRLGRQPLRKQPVDLSSLVNESLKALRAGREGRQFQITVNKLPSCEGDALLLKQVFMNLLSNAHKYTRAREIARIEVGALALKDLIDQEIPMPPEDIMDGHSVVYYVRDNGVGFDMRYAGKLFGVFQRLHLSGEYEGTGVGLANVQRIIHRHGGRVWADAAVNQGATFYFTLSGPGEPGLDSQESILVSEQE